MTMTTTATGTTNSAGTLVGSTSHPTTAAKMLTAVAITATCRSLIPITFDQSHHRM